MEPYDEWQNIHLNDLWVYNKLFLSRKLNYLCGPIGVPVPVEGYYIIRPQFNILGMGRNARIEYIKDTTDHYHPSEFWCEVFTGDHISVDYYHKEPKLVVKGTRDPNNPLYKWEKWSKIDKKIEFPPILYSLSNNYEWINCEFIGNRLIEVHFRQNPDFKYGNSEAIPIWNEDFQQILDGYRYIKDEDYLRKGFYIN